MREIKFRAWIDDSKLGFDLADTMLYMCDKYEQLCVFFNDCEYYNLMQYTGLKDKNGVDIYEGDIVELTDSNDDRIKEWNIVTFDNGEFRASKHIKGDIFVSDLVSFHNRPDLYCEVIGNIYENEDLLK